jgi:hypothetical protein
LASFTLKENLSEKERVRELLLHGKNSLQQNYVFQNAKSIFRDNIDSIQEELIPLVLSELLKWSEGRQVQAGEMFEMLLSEKILNQQFKPELKSKCMEMIKMWSKSVLLQWINVLMLLEPSTEEFKLLMVDMSQRQQPEAVRCACLRLLEKQRTSGVKFDASKVVQNLLNDFSWTVRKTLAECLPQICVNDKESVLNELL